jgi:hypothetical protein
MTPIGARCALRHDQKFVSRTPASVGLHHFHFRRSWRTSAPRSLGQSTGTIDRQDRQAFLLATRIASRHDLVACALRRDRGGASTPRGAAKRRFARAGRPPASFFPARAVSSAFLLPVPGARELGFHRGR